MSSQKLPRKNLSIKIFVIGINILLIATTVALILSGHLFVRFGPEKINVKKNSLDTKIAVPCNSIPRENLMVALVFGESNAVNNLETPWTPKSNVYNFFRGNCFLASDPLVGATGTKGSVWTRLGDKIIEEGLYDNILFLPTGVDKTNIAYWTPTGLLRIVLPLTVKDIEDNNLEITHMFWHHGETDSTHEISKERYKKLFNEMLDGIRELGVTAPIYVSIASMNGTDINKEIQEAQQELVDHSKGIIQGPNTDTLIEKKYRYGATNINFSTEGTKKFADMWIESLKAGEKIYPTPVINQ